MIDFTREYAVTKIQSVVSFNFKLHLAQRISFHSACVATGYLRSWKILSFNWQVSIKFVINRHFEYEYSNISVDCVFRKAALVYALLFFTNVPLMVYFGLIHQRGPLDSINFLAGRIASSPNSSVLFLMPCHSTPLYR